MLDQLQEELKIALKAGEKAKMMGLRNIIGKIKAAQIDKGETLTDEESSKILKIAAKQLKESIDQYQKGGREDLAEKEAFELTLLEKYLPEQLSEEHIRQIVKNTSIRLITISGGVIVMNLAPLGQFSESVFHLLTQLIFAL